MKGFTLIELLAVIIVLGLIAIIVTPAITKSIKESQERMYNEQIDQIENIARNWGVSNTDLLPESGYYYLTLDTLKSEGLLEDKDIISPLDNTKMSGCIVINFDNDVKQYVYKYNKECNTN